MSGSQQKLYASQDGSTVSFPAFVRLPASARPNSRSLLSNNHATSIKCVTITSRLLTRPSYLTTSDAAIPSYKAQIASRWGISEEMISAIIVNLQDERVLIENPADWHSWVNAFFFRSAYSSGHCGSGPPKEDFAIPPVHIDVIVDSAEDASQTSTTQEALPTQPQDAESSDPAEELPSYATAAASEQAAPSAQRQQASPHPGAAIASHLVAPVLQSLAPQIRDLVDTLAGSISTLSANVARAHNLASTSNAQSSRFTPADQPAAAGPTVPVAPETVVPAQTEAASPPEGGAEAQRQSLIDGLFDELSHIRGQRETSSPAQQPPQDTTTGSTGEGMRNELSEAFAEMLARQRSDASAGPSREARSEAAQLDNEDDESLTIVSTPSTSSCRSSRSRSPRRSQRTSLLTSTTLTLLTLLTFLLALISPTTATALSPHPLSTRANYVTPSTNSRHLHLCKCTCFQTNSTLVPLYSPADPAKPCLTCTRQFCLDQGLDICKGAKLEHADHDVGTGFEGDVWAKCFERDSYKDQGIITMYILVVVGLVVCAAMRGRLEGWVERYQGMGPQGLYSAVRGAPWRRGAR